MNIDFEEIEAVCGKQDNNGECNILVEAETTCRMDDPGFEQDCECVEAHCPLKNSQKNIEPKLQSAAPPNTTKAKIYQDISESIYKFIYENEDTPVIDPDSLKAKMVSIIADKLSAIC